MEWEKVPYAVHTKFIPSSCGIFAYRRVKGIEARITPYELVNEARCIFETSAVVLLVEELINKQDSCVHVVNPLHSLLTV